MHVQSKQRTHAPAMKQATMHPSRNENMIMLQSRQKDTMSMTMTSVHFECFN
jgi:hypothetical protein